MKAAVSGGSIVQEKKRSVSLAATNSSSPAIAARTAATPKNHLRPWLGAASDGALTGASLRRGAGHLDVAGPLDVLPPQPHAAHRADRCLGDDQVHQLAVDELLQGHRPQRSEALAIETERVDPEQELKEVERNPGRDHRHRIEEDDAVDGR